MLKKHRGSFVLGSVLVSLVAFLVAGRAVDAAAQGDDKKIDESLIIFNRGKMLHSEKRYDEAIVEYQRSLKLYDEDAWVWNYMALAMTAKRDFKGALKSFEKALALNPELTDIHNNLGVVYDQMGRRDKAFEEFGRVLRDPTYPTPEKTFYNLGDLYLQEKNYELAVMHFNRAVEKKPKFAMGYRGLGYAYMAMGKPEAATREFERAIEADPKDLPSLFELARINDQGGKTSEALSFYRRIVEADRFSQLGKLSLSRLEGAAKK